MQCNDIRLCFLAKADVLRIIVLMKLLSAKIKKFQQSLKSYYRRHGRDMPWRETRDPYHILVSEMMLQQTQVERVIGYYEKFLAQFPDVAVLARAPLADVLAAWQGLGYNRRALYLKHAAEEIVARHGSAVPADPTLLAKLPGIGTGTAGAIAAFAFNAPLPFIETNIRRVYLHFFFPRRRAVPDSALMSLIEETMDRKNPREWYYALMDYGTMLGAAEKGKNNPNRRSKHYARQARFKGSDRQIRAGIIRLILAKKRLTIGGLSKKLKQDPQRIQRIVALLIHEGFIKKSGSHFTILP